MAETGTVSNLSRESLRGLVDSVGGALTMLVMRASKDEERLSYMLAAEKRTFLEKVRIAVQASLITSYGVSAQLAPSFADAYIKALVYRIESSRANNRRKVDAKEFPIEDNEED